MKRILAGTLLAGTLAVIGMMSFAQAETTLTVMAPIEAAHHDPARQSAGSPLMYLVGDTLVWVNRDVLRHTATDRGQAFVLVLEPGATAKTVLNAAGHLRVYCRYHPGMTAEIEVLG